MAIDFSIIGAPKCGTTSIAYYLSCHPKVDFSSIKEPFYYNTQTPGVQGINKESTYHSLFKNDGGLKGEGSTWYLYSKEAVANILKENSNAKFIICLRNPINAVVSWHAHMQLVGAELEPDINKAWEQTDDRLSKNIKIPVYGDVRMLDYKTLYNYGDQFERLYDICPNNQIHVVTFSDLCKAPSVVYSNLLQFLGVSHDSRTEFPIQYPRVNTKSNILRYFGSKLSYSNRVELTRLALRFGVDLYELYFKLNTSKAIRNTIPENIRNKLDNHYQPQLSKLEKIAGISL